MKNLIIIIFVLVTSISLLAQTKNYRFIGVEKVEQADSMMEFSELYYLVVESQGKSIEKYILDEEWNGSKGLEELKKMSSFVKKNGLDLAIDFGITIGKRENERKVKSVSDDLVVYRTSDRVNDLKFANTNSYRNGDTAFEILDNVFIHEIEILPSGEMIATKGINKEFSFKEYSNPENKIVVKSNRVRRDIISGLAKSTPKIDLDYLGNSNAIWSDVDNLEFALISALPAIEGMAAAEKASNVKYLEGFKLISSTELCSSCMTAVLSLRNEVGRVEKIELSSEWRNSYDHLTKLDRLARMDNLNIPIEVTSSDTGEYISLKIASIATLSESIDVFPKIFGIEIESMTIDFTGEVLLNLNQKHMTEVFALTNDKTSFNQVLAAYAESLPKKSRKTSLTPDYNLVSQALASQVTEHEAMNLNADVRDSPLSRMLKRLESVPELKRVPMRSRNYYKTLSKYNSSKKSMFEYKNLNMASRRAAIAKENMATYQATANGLENALSANHKRSESKIVGGFGARQRTLDNFLKSDPTGENLIFAHLYAAGFGEEAEASGQKAYKKPSLNDKVVTLVDITSRNKQYSLSYELPNGEIIQSQLSSGWAQKNNGRGLKNILRLEKFTKENKIKLPIKLSINKASELQKIIFLDKKMFNPNSSYSAPKYPLDSEIEKITLNEAGDVLLGRRNEITMGQFDLSITAESFESLMSETLPKQIVSQLPSVYEYGKDKLPLLHDPIDIVSTNIHAGKPKVTGNIYVGLMTAKDATGEEIFLVIKNKDGKIENLKLSKNWMEANNGLGYKKLEAWNQFVLETRIESPIRFRAAQGSAKGITGLTFRYSREFSSDYKAPLLKSHNEFVHDFTLSSKGKETVALSKDQSVKKGLELKIHVIENFIENEANLNEYKNSLLGCEGIYSL